MASVAPRTKMISRVSAALRKRCTVCRAASCASVACTLRVVNAAMDVGVHVLVVARDGVDDDLRLLRSGGVVQIDQRLAVDPLGEDGKIGADPGEIEAGLRALGTARRASGSRTTVWASSGHPTSSQFRGSLPRPRPRRDGGLMVRCQLGEPIADERLRRTRARAARLHAVEALAGKGVEQQVARRGLVDAARAQVEELLLLDLADGGAVRAFHVVGVNLELRLGVDARVVGEQQVAVGLLGVGLLRVLVHDDAAVEYAARMSRRECRCRTGGCEHCGCACSTSM